MNDVVFTPQSWVAASERVQEASDAFSRGAHRVTVAAAIAAPSSSPVDAAAVRGDSGLLIPWYELVGKAVEALNSDASKMAATGANYAQMEERGTRAAERFWS
ncbi:hypothetical protein SAMN02745244_03681 [Tessaracoccus bendigoensis DSM 12906]|uniref:Excreted virulence factor EspC, type VII ESX diderm n=1 Tax=Tessaracoccus bendigoensis DSM 12906 TaxID=1123357 RepID=A0A1M6NNU9_9ACTN|nr:hypothetical protein [Tessaracoccus bendigoensis]SHJ97334.1 hypothetical protein SAMN02745244_03681 [Tessaracoccus bendigoensis DSM 12906]